MQIKAFTEKYNISSDTARFYEAEGLLSPVRMDNGYRMYDEGCEKAIKLIIVLKQVGFSLQEIKQLLELAQRPISQECNISSTLMFSNKIQEIQHKISFYQAALAALQMAGQLMEQGSYALHRDKLDTLMDEMYIQVAANRSNEAEE